MSWHTKKPNISDQAQRTGEVGLAAAPWHFGQCLLRHELYETSVCSQLSQRVTCPPSAAVRQRSMADMTFSCPILMWPALA